MTIGDLLGVALAGLVDDPDLVLSSGVGNVGDVFTVRRPGSGVIIRARAAGQVAGRAFLDRCSEDVAAGNKGGARTPALGVWSRA